MRVLVTGGTGVVGDAAVRALLARGHTVRLLSRHAADDAADFPGGVETREGSVGDAKAVRGAAEGCDAVLHVAGIVAETPPESTFERVNVEGTRFVVEEARRAGVPRLVYVSSLGAGRGSSDYHRSKRRAEERVREFDGRWTIVRPGNVYGPGDGVVSLLLTMVRTLPAIPVVGHGDQPFQPIAAGDLGRALTGCIERDDLGGRVIELAGDDVTTMSDLLDRMERVTGRSPTRVRVPAAVAGAGARLAALAGIDIPVQEDQIVMLEEENVLSTPEHNALRELFGIEPTPLDEGLRRLADRQPEQLPKEGVGALMRRRYWVDIHGSRYDADTLFEIVCREFDRLTPDATVSARAEPSTGCELREGATLTLDLPIRGHVQVRVLDVSGRVATLVTLAGHPLAGANRIGVQPRDGALRFQVETFDRAASLPDLVAIATVGRVLKDATWSTMAERVVARSGGTAPEEVHETTETLGDDDAAALQGWLESLVARRKRATPPPAAARREEPRGGEAAAPPA